VVKDDDLVVGTHGRSFWILDDISPLRQLQADALARDVLLFRPALATRVRWNMNTDTPLPPDEPAGQNPPDGAVLHYHLRAKPAGPVTLEILDGAGQVVRRFRSDDAPEPPVPGRNIPDYWIRPSRPLSAEPGLHRFVWDLRHPPPAVLSFGYPIAAIHGDTPRTPAGPWVMPGEYTVRLTADGRVQAQPLAVRMDPRVKTPEADLRRQLDLSLAVAEALRREHEALTAVRAARAGVKKARDHQKARGLVRSLDALEAALAGLEGAGGGEFGGGGGGADTLVRMNGQLATLLAILQGADRAPTTQAAAAVEDRLRALEALLARWKSVRDTEVTVLDRRLRAAGLAPLLPRP
jgi:hypothetical protein